VYAEPKRDGLVTETHRTPKPDGKGKFMTQDAEIRERLSEIWGAWTLTPDEALSDKLVEACGPVAAWLESGKNNPEIVIRAIQVLLADPESTTMNQRQSWKSLRKELSKLWPNAGTGKDHFFYVQALLLAAWPRDEEGFFRVKHLIDSGWNLQARQALREIEEWRKPNPLRQPAHEVRNASTIAVAASTLTGKTGEAIELNVDDALTHIEQNKQHGHVAQIGPQLVHVLKTHNAALREVSNLLSQTTERLNNAPLQTKQQLTKLQALIDSNRDKLDLLWWGQSRYCRALRKPYRRLKADQPALLWWTAREAAEFAQSVEVEPAAAYLVQTLENLGQSVGDEKAVVEWMQLLYTALVQSAEKVPALSKRLDQIAKEDALGLPVTWVRRQVMQNKPFDDKQAREDVALPLDTRIDLGDWASWIFRETLLDLHLADTQS